MKICLKCNIEKPLVEFGTRTRNSHGKRGRCKECEKQDRQESYLRKPSIKEREKLQAKNWYYSNKEHCQNRQKIWCEKNKERRYIYQRNNQLKNRYNISLEQYQEMLIIQDGKCKICRTANPGMRRKTFFVDHCHKTNIVRGLLCVQCNLAIGQFNDNPELIRIASNYVELNGKI